MYKLTGVTKRYQKGRATVDALAGVDVVIEDGEWLAIQGPTGHGKSTLLQMLGGLDRPTSGSIMFGGSGGGFPGGGTGGNGGGFNGGFHRLANALNPTHTIVVHLTAPVTIGAIVAAVVLAVAGGLIAGAFGGWRAARLRPAAALARVE